MSDALTEKKPAKGFDASGNEIDLSEFEESYYKPGQVQDILEQVYNKSLECTAQGIHVVMNVDHQYFGTYKKVET